MRPGTYVKPVSDIVEVARASLALPVKMLLPAFLSVAIVVVLPFVF